MLSVRFSSLLFLVCLAAGCNNGGPMDPGGPIPGAIGARCARNADCNSRLCLEAGRCTEPCTEVSECPETWTCDGVAGAGLLCQCTVTSPEEICNGIDDECDGRVDNGATCGPGLTCEAGACLCPIAERCGGECVDRMSDVRNCGGCGIACAAGQVCEAGACTISCSAGTTRCGDSCVRTDTDVRNCGGCGTSCGAGGICDGGSCFCTGDLVACGAGCANLADDRANCGGCGVACSALEVCRDAACVCADGLRACSAGCVDVRTDEANCGDCGNACDAGAVCEGGVCNAPDAPIGNPCTSDAVCAPGTCIRAASGFPSGYCTAGCDFDSCPAGATCVALDYGGGDIRMNCLLSCTSPGDCRAGYTCQSSFDGDYCFPG